MIWKKKNINNIKLLENDCIQLKNEQKNFNKIILENIESINNEIDNIKKTIEENNNNNEENLEIIEADINKKMPLSNFNSEINLLKEDVNQIKNNKSYEILPILLQKIEILENKLSNGNNI